MSLTSTVPAAVAALQVKMQTVAAAHPELSPGVYVGEIIGTVANNFLCIGPPMGEGEMIVNYAGNYDNISATSRSESYGLGFSIRAWDETIDPIARLTDAFTLLNALAVELVTDLDGSGALGSGNWGIGDVGLPVAGKFDGRGWGVMLTGRIDVNDVYLDQ